MSLSNLLQPNSYEIYARSGHIESMFVTNVNNLPYIPPPPAPGGTSLAVSKSGTQGVTGSDPYTIIAPWQVNVPGDFTNLAFNLTTGIFTAPVDGKYHITATIYIRGVTGLATNPNPSLYINSTIVKEASLVCNSLGTEDCFGIIDSDVFLNLNDQVTIRIAGSDVDYDILDVNDTTASVTYLSIHLFA